MSGLIDECPNGFTDEEIFTEFCKDDTVTKKCSTCPNMRYENGLMTCAKNQLENE